LKSFGKHLRNQQDELPKKGESGFTRPTDRTFADQNAGRLNG
jgi:hypothetical protein